MPTLGHITRLKTGEQDMLILAALTKEMEFATDRKAGPQGTIPGLLGLLVSAAPAPTSRPVPAHPGFLRSSGASVAIENIRGETI